MDALHSLESSHLREHNPRLQTEPSRHSDSPGPHGVKNVICLHDGEQLNALYLSFDGSHSSFPLTRPSPHFASGFNQLHPTKNKRMVAVKQFMFRRKRHLRCRVLQAGNPDWCCS